MGKQRWWLGIWLAITVLWVLYWSGLGLALGMAGIQEMIAGLPGPVLFCALCLSVPAALYLAGHLIAGLGCRAWQTSTGSTQRP